MERSVKRRVCDKLNEGAGTLVYMDMPWEDLAHRLLEAIDVLEEGPDSHADD